MTRKITFCSFIAILTLLFGVNTLSAASSCKIKENVFPGSAANNNVSISYLTAGNKKNPVVLLIHGNGGTADSWRGVMKKMCKNFYLVAPYRRGTLPSGQPDTGNKLVDYSLSVTATDFQLVLQQLGVKNPNVIAHSYSGLLAEQYYFQYLNDPTYAAATMTLLDTVFAGLIPGPGSIAFSAAVASGNLDAIAASFSQYAVTVQCNCPTSLKTLAKLEREVYESALQTSLYAYESTGAVYKTLSSSNFVPPLISIPNIPFHGPATANPIGTFANISIPVYILNGSSDEFVLPINLSILGVSFPNAFVEELRGLPHFSMLTNYKVLARKFTEFLKNENEPCSFLFSPKPHSSK